MIPPRVSASPEVSYLGMYMTFKQISPSELERLQKNPSLVKYDPSGLDVDKTWQVMHFLLTGDAWGGAPPLAKTIMGGTDIGEDLGYGPARYLMPEEVREVASALSGVSIDDLRKRFDPAALEKAEVYPGFSGAVEHVGVDPAAEPEMKDFLEFLLKKFEGLVSFYAEAASKGNAMLLFLI